MLYHKIPKKFKPKFEVVSCFCESNNEILLLKRNASKPQGGTWGVPAGKIDTGEKIIDAIIREIYEESGIKLQKYEITLFKKVYLKYPDLEFIYYMFAKKFNERPEVVIQNKEHQEYKWIAPRNALKMNLIEDLDKCIKLYYRENL